MTALYEIIPVGAPRIQPPAPDANPFVVPAPPRPTQPSPTPIEETSPALLRLRLRYKPPLGTKSRLIESDVTDEGLSFERADAEFHWSAAVAAFGMRLRRESERGQASYAAILEWARPAVGEDKRGYRKEFIALIERAHTLSQ